jgi:hypothetical protein
MKPHNVSKNAERLVNSVTVGYGTVPITKIKGRFAWALPGRKFTFSYEEAREMAIKLNTAIREEMAAKVSSI